MTIIDQKQPQNESSESLMTITSKHTYQHDVQSGFSYTTVLILLVYYICLCRNYYSW